MPKKYENPSLKAELHLHSSMREPENEAVFSWGEIIRPISYLKKYFGSRNRVFYPPFFHDSIQDVEAIAWRLIELKIRIVAITDHDSLDGYMMLERINKERKLGLIVVPGCEISSNEGDILAYGIKRKIEQGLGAAETISMIHEQGGIAVAAHPYMPFALGDRIYRRGFDAIEVFNSLASRRKNGLAESAARKLSLPGIVGSDAHQKEEIGRSLMLFPKDTKDYHDVIKHIKRGDFETIRAGTSLFQMALRHILGDIRMILRK